MLVLAIGYGASIGGIGTPMGSGENAIASGQLNQVMDFGFFPWMVYGLPVVVVLIPITWVMLLWLFVAQARDLETTPVPCANSCGAARTQQRRTGDPRRAGPVHRAVGRRRRHRALAAPAQLRC